MDTSLLDKNIEEVKKAHGGAVWKWLHDDGEEEMFLFREIRDTENPSVPLGYMQISIKSEVMKEQMEAFLETFPGYAALWDVRGQELLGKGQKTVKKEEINKMLKEGKNFTSMNKEGIISYCSKIENSQWAIISSMRTQDFFAENESIKVLFVAVIASSLGICSILVFVMAKLITKPLEELTRQTKEISRDNYDIHLDIVSNDEIGILAENFNEMAKRLDELVNEVLRHKVLQQEAQFNALQAQINPHFLYNNLDTAYWMSRIEKAEKTGKILLALSALYRSAARSGSKTIPVSEEEKYARDYITIQELRLGNQIKFDFFVEDTAREFLTLRFILQPLIENSIEHGILPGGEGGYIFIRIYTDQEFLYFQVEDSGNETSAEEITELLRAECVEGRRGMAIRNIHQRLQLQYGQKYGLSFLQAQCGGILTVVRQPIMKKQ